MVARINGSKSINKTLSYNEHKVRDGTAELIAESGFLKDMDKLTFYDKLNHFKRIISLSPNVKVNALHVSLNFDPSEKLTAEKLNEIAAAYMTKIGFADQPYLVYRHHDAAHPHIHIVSTPIKIDGTRISLHNIGRNQSEKARKEIESLFRLIPAESKKQTSVAIKPLAATIVQQGKAPVKAAISNVLRQVIPSYKYSSLKELNAVLRLYNVEAERCGKAGDRYKHRGLVYRIIDSNGMQTGTAIKASLFAGNPTLQNLEKRFRENSQTKSAFARRVRVTVDLLLLGEKKKDLVQLSNELKGQNIILLFHKSVSQNIYGLTYIDLETKCVFKGSDLGKAYSALAILEKCSGKKIEIPTQKHPAILNERGHPQDHSENETLSGKIYYLFGDAIEKVIEPEKSYDSLPYHFRKRKKKRKKLNR